MVKREQPEAVVSFRIGDRVRIKNYAGKLGRITEFRGPLGPGGAPVYRVLVQKKPTISYIELLGDQLEYVPKKGQAGSLQKRPDTPKAKKGTLKPPGS